MRNSQRLSTANHFCPKIESYHTVNFVHSISTIARRPSFARWPAGLLDGLPDGNGLSFAFVEELSRVNPLPIRPSVQLGTVCNSYKPIFVSPSQSRYSLTHREMLLMMSFVMRAVVDSRCNRTWRPRDGHAADAEVRCEERGELGASRTTVSSHGQYAALRRLATRDRTGAFSRRIPTSSAWNENNGTRVECT
jgi:hypothetical protein